MCIFGGNKKPAPTEAAAPPPPPPADAPRAPAFNEASSDATSANNAVASKRRGRSALRVDLNSASSGSGLNIPT